MVLFAQNADEVVATVFSTKDAAERELRYTLENYLQAEPAMTDLTFKRSNIGKLVRRSRTSTINPRGDERFWLEVAGVYA